MSICSCISWRFEFHDSAFPFKYFFNSLRPCSLLLQSMREVTGADDHGVFGMRWQGYPYVYCLQNAVGALRMLAIENEINKDAIRLAGGVRALVRVLEGSCDHRDVMVRTRPPRPASLFHHQTYLAGCAYPEVVLVGEALLTHMHKIRLPDQQVQCLAAAGLAALAYDNVHNQKAIIQDGGDAVLLSVLSVARDARLVGAPHLSKILYRYIAARGASRWRRFSPSGNLISALGCCPAALDRWITWPLPCLSSPTTTRKRPWLWQRSERPSRKSCAFSRGICPHRREKR